MDKSERFLVVGPMIALIATGLGAGVSLYRALADGDWFWLLFALNLSLSVANSFILHQNVSRIIRRHDIAARLEETSRFVKILDDLTSALVVKSPRSKSDE